MRRALEIAVSAILGAVVATIGAVAHRSYPPVGVILCVLLVLLSAVFVRAWCGWTGLLSFAAPLAVLSYIFTLEGPGGSLLIAGDGLGQGWLLGGAAAVVVAALVPVRLLGGGRSVASP